MRFSNIFTEADNTTLDIKRVLMIPAGIAAPVALQAVAMWKGQTFSVVDFCTGYAAILTALAALLALHAWAGGENTGKPE